MQSFQGFVSPPNDELGIFCMLSIHVNHYTMDTNEMLIKYILRSVQPGQIKYHKQRHTDLFSTLKKQQKQNKSQLWHRVPSVDHFCC